MRELITSLREGDEVMVTCPMGGWLIECVGRRGFNGSPSRHRWGGAHSFTLLSAENTPAVSTPVLTRGVFDFCRSILLFLPDSLSLNLHRVYLFGIFNFSLFSHLFNDTCPH